MLRDGDRSWTRILRRDASSFEKLYSGRLFRLTRHLLGRWPTRLKLHRSWCDIRDRWGLADRRLWLSRWLEDDNRRCLGYRWFQNHWVCRTPGWERLMFLLLGLLTLPLLTTRT